MHISAYAYWGAYAYGQKKKRACIEYKSLKSATQRVSFVRRLMGPDDGFTFH